MIIEILFWLSVGAIFHSYILYPLMLAFMARKKTDNKQVFIENDELPKVSVLMSLFNEEEVIAEKLKSIYASKYPAEKLEIRIGSDNSTDNTNTIVTEFCKHHPNLFFTIYNSRQGKGNVINKLYDSSTGEIIILTDANVMFSPTTIFELSKHFKNSEIGLVDTHMINSRESIATEGISVQESAYISREVKIKNYESRIWGTMMGPFGGCFAIRKELYFKVPQNFLVDDFYINMKVLEKEKKAINYLNAWVFEDVSNNLNDEFRRKVRIATGNFQNLKVFSHFLCYLFGAIPKQPLQKRNFYFGLAFSFFSHKILRWFGPFFILMAIACSIALYQISLYKYLFLLFCFSLILPIIDFLLRKLNIHIVPLRFITHFYSMNVALLSGFFKYLKGVKTNVWQPTKRNQSQKKSA